MKRTPGVFSRFARKRARRRASRGRSSSARLKASILKMRRRALIWPSSGGGAAGAFAGAYFGEEGMGRTQAERIAIGQGAMIGRLLGTAGKLLMGIVMLVIITLDSFYDFAESP